jgi:hypothetical protein
VTQNSRVNRHSIAVGWLVCSSLLTIGFANAALKPTVVQAEFKRWAAELETLLQAQPKSSELRKTLKLWFTDQGRSLSRVKEPMLSASLPSKLWGSAAFVTDSANQNFSALTATEYLALSDFSDRVLDFCRAGYQPRQSVCTDDHYWELKAKNALYRAQLAETDFRVLLASVPTMVQASFEPLTGSFAAQDAVEIASNRCMGWFRIWANFLTPEFNNQPDRLRETAFVEAYIAQAAETLRLCDQAKANPAVFTRHIADMGVAVVEAAKLVSPEAQRLARPIAERAYAIVLHDRDDAGSTTQRPDRQLMLLLLAQSLGDRAQAQGWASAIPKLLAEINERTGDEFNCRFFIAETQRAPDAWREATSAFPEDYRAMQAACPGLDSR